MKNHGIISHTPSRWPGIFSFLITGSLFSAVLILTLTNTLNEARQHDQAQLQLLSGR
jgi:hypothetical protein